MKPTPSPPRTARQILPDGVALSIGALLVASLVGTAAVAWSGHSITEPDAATVASRMLRFQDGADGSVVVIDNASGLTAARFEGEQGFVRGTLRALVRERRQSGAGAETPFQLVLRADARLTLVDPATGTRIDLESFGPTNKAVFGSLLAPPTLTPSRP